MGDRAGRSGGLRLKCFVEAEKIERGDNQYSTWQVDVGGTLVSVSATAPFYF